jgi:hypothetical protein
MLRNLAENFECLLVLPWCLALFDLPEKVVKPGLECGGESIKLWQRLLALLYSSRHIVGPAGLPPCPWP